MSTTIACCHSILSEGLHNRHVERVKILFLLHKTSVSYCRWSRVVSLSKNILVHFSKSASIILRLAIKSPFYNVFSSRLTTRFCLSHIRDASSSRRAKRSGPQTSGTNCGCDGCVLREISRLQWPVCKCSKLEMASLMEFVWITNLKKQLSSTVE